jgi:hypothetical protein
MYGYFLGDEPQDQYNGGSDFEPPIGTNAEYQARIAAPAQQPNPLEQFMGGAGFGMLSGGGGSSFTPAPADRLLNQVKSVDWNDESWRGGYANTGGSDFDPNPQQNLSGYGATPLPLPDQSQYQSLGLGLTGAQSRDAMNATGFGVANAQRTAEAERGGAWGGMPLQPFVSERPMPGHTLGYQGSFMGGSRGYSNDDAGQQWDAMQRQRLGMSEIEGRNQRARESAAMDMARFGLASQDRQEAIKQRQQAKIMDILKTLPEGKRLPFIQQGMHDGGLDKDVGSAMLIPEVIKGSAQGAMKDGKLSDLRAFLGNLQQRYDPKTMDGNELIQALQGMNIDPNKVKEYVNDPQIGKFAQSLLGPDVIQQTRGFGPIWDSTKNAASRVGGGIWDFITQ